MALARDVANFFIDLANRNNDEDMTNLRLNKLMYFAQGWSLALLGKPLFNDPIEAWKYGPVVPEIYHKYKIYGNRPITQIDSDYSFSNIAEDEADLLLDVAREYSVYSSPTLVHMSHMQDGPWDRSYNIMEGMVISQREMKEHFELLPKLATFSDNTPDIVEARRDPSGILILPKELDDDYEV